MGLTLVNLLAALCVVLALVLVAGYVRLQRHSRAAERRTREYKLLTEIGQAVTSQLEPDAVLAAIHKELAQFFDTSAFYVAFVDQARGMVDFAFETEEGLVQPKRSRPVTDGFTEYIVRTGQPLLIEDDLERVRGKLGVVVLGRPARCFCGVPLIMKGRSAGVMAVLHYEREGAYKPADIEILETAARNVVIAIENARLFAAEQKRARYLAFINTVSRTAISSQNAEEMLAAIVAEIQKNFQFDHIGVGIVDYSTKEIQIQAEAGTTAQASGKRVPLGAGIMGKVARTSETLQMQASSQPLLSVLADARSVLCIPISYGDTLLGILNVESRRDSAFASEDVLMMETLADLLSTALHNAFIYQKMEHQSITDPLTGIKTRRFFNEALQSEFKRGMRSGRPFSVVLIDLDKFKEVNDSQGHLEGDLVLARIGRLLDQKVRQSNIVARYGGDEFVILMPETSSEQACALSERLRLWIATDPMLSERHITGSFGVAEYPLHGNNVDDIVRMADIGMYASKRAGGNRVSVPELSAEAGGQSEQRKLISSYLAGLLRREHFASADEIMQALGRIKAAVPPEEASAALRQAVRMITRAVETRELHSTGHGETVASYVAAMARQMPFSPAEIEDLIFAAQVHDVGKIVVPEAILTKAGSLTFDEFSLMKSHPAVGAEIVSALPGSDDMQKFVRCHQEHLDGNGYPGGIREADIPLGARVIGVAEAYVNMISGKPYAEGKSPSEAMQELERGCGTHFDAAVVSILIEQLRGVRATAAHSE